MDEQPDPPESQGKSGWIDRLAEQSAGLPGNEPAKKSADGSATAGLAGIGIELAGSVAIFAVMGYYLDRWMGWSPWGMLAMTAIGVVGGLYLVIKRTMRIDK